MYPADPVFVKNDDSQITYNDPTLARQDSNLTADASVLIGRINNTYSDRRLTVSTGPGMKFEFIFYGRIVQVYGAVIPWLTGQQPRAEYAIDGDPEFNLVPSLPSPQSNVSFYVSALLPITFHTLTVTVLNATADAPFLFDYLVYGFLDASEDPNPPNTASSTTSLSSASTDTTSQSSSTASVSATTGPGQSSIPSGPMIAIAHSSGLGTGPIVGIALACVFFAGMAALFYWRRLRRRYTQSDRDSIEPAEPPDPKPADDTALRSLSTPPDISAGQNTPGLSRAARDPADRWPYQQTSPLREKSAYSPATIPQEHPTGSPATPGPSSVQFESTDPPGPVLIGRASSPLSGVMSFDGKEVRLASPPPRSCGTSISDADCVGTDRGDARHAVQPERRVKEGAPPPYEP
ncbi:hypothetical protein OH77DRAFT_814923 [Trametes cingulata]|nr:hypothetical protein OH77DRAFT_814923 [Trametes cingulata]